MPNLNVGLSLALGMTTSMYANEANWALGGVDYYAGNAGDVCYTHTDSHVVYSCECDWNVTQYYECPGDDGCGTRVNQDGSYETVCYVLDCRLAGDVANDYARFCWEAGAPSACDACGCTNSSSTWTSTGSGNRVKRTVTSVSDGNYSCTSSTTTEYGCAAGYYKSAGSGSSMTCTACPSGGTSVDGNSSGIGACCMAAGSSFTDTKGTYTCSGQACYQS